MRCRKTPGLFTYRFPFTWWWQIVETITILTINFGFRNGHSMPPQMLFSVIALCAGFAWFTLPLARRFLWGMSIWRRSLRTREENEED